jgi:hypothetical protein
MFAQLRRITKGGVMKHSRSNRMGSTAPPWKNVLINFLQHASMPKRLVMLVAGLCSMLSCADLATAPESVAVKAGLIPNNPSPVMTFNSKWTNIIKTVDCEQCGDIEVYTYGNLGPSYYQTRSVTKLFAVYNYGTPSSAEYECSNFFNADCFQSWNLAIPCNVYRVNMSATTIHVLQGYGESAKGNSYDSLDCGAEPNPSNPGGNPTTAFQVGGSADNCPPENRYSAWLVWPDGSHSDVFLGWVCIYNMQ